MRDYGKVHSTFWTSETILCLSEDGKLLALYLLTGPHTDLIGVFRLPDGYVAADLKWSVERVSKGFDELFQNGFATRENSTGWGIIHRYLKFNPLENPNQVKSAIKIFEQISSSSIVKSLAANYLSEFKPEFKKQTDETQGLLNRFETLLKPFRNPFETSNSNSNSNSKSPPTPPEGGSDAVQKKPLPADSEQPGHAEQKQPDEPEDKKPPDKPVYPDDFERFFQAYPKKAGKGQALATWQKLKQSKVLPPVPDLLAAIEKQKQGWGWLKDNGQYIQNPSSWLNAHGWLNETIPPPGRASPGVPDNVPEELRGFSPVAQRQAMKTMAALQELEKEQEAENG